VKIDRRDARALACVLGADRSAHRVSDPQRHVRGRLLIRDALVRTRTRYVSLIRALPRQQGYRVPSGSLEAFATRVRALAMPGPLLSLIAPLLAVMRSLNVDGVGHYLPILGAPPRRLAWMDHARALTRWVALHSFVEARKP
jgi:hypothetical protein